MLSFFIHLITSNLESNGNHGNKVCKKRQADKQTDEANAIAQFYNT